ncbi:MAG: TonB-dependent receptor, partial [bacterium]|nr:TonB-dependent receptor [bacterium]
EDNFKERTMNILIITLCIVSIPPVPADTIPFYEMEELVITATRTKLPLFWLPTNVVLVTREEINKHNAITAAGILEKILIDVASRGTRGAERGARLREGGSTSRHVLVMLDGQPLNDPFLGTADLDAIITDYIGSIEIVKGPISALYGTSALGGVINIITQKTLKNRNTFLSLSAGSFDTRRISFNSCLKKSNIDVAFVINREKTAGFRENSDYNGRDVFLSFLAGFKNRGSGRGRLLWHDSKLGVPGMNCTPIERYDGESERKAQFLDARQRRTKEYGEIEYRQGDFLSIKINNSYIDTRYKCGSANIDDDSRGKTYGGDAQINLPLGFIIGYNIQWNEFTKQTSGENTVPKSTQNWSVFTQNILSKGFLRFVSGIRYDHHSVFGGVTNPRFALVFRVSENLKLSSTLGRAFRAPGIEDLYSPYSSWPVSEWGPAGDTRGNLNLLPETGWGYDIGIEYKGENIISGITLSKNRIRNLIEWAEVDPDPNYEKWRPSNIGESYNRTMEAVVEILGILGTCNSFKYNYLESKGKKGEDDYKTLMYSPPHRFSYQLSGNAFGIRFNGDISYTDEVEWEDDFGFLHKLPAYTLVNFSVGRKMKNINLSFSVNNIFDKKYQTREHYPLPGREVHLKTVFSLPN